ncbi:GNAT family N-acetyltransferase [Actinomadura parmotrematis]|uniref:GNAT family N-acetyltransferase n=1 Tax=Actinomadura parmotrematis TaxID=2864039 RepID=A0ABS7FNL8_9ACTN|nr:GNAT family N-acetyltransferase [Actinomadura parmotrematis]MBW8481979.1 GNAT family N-acetyltransferase [Actinomadura parmotrematis]
MKKLDDRPPATRAGLRDVRIRPYGSGDAARLRAMSAAVSGESLYTRFFGGTPAIPESYVRALAGLDHWDREALAALVDGDMVGIAEYFRDGADPARAECAVLVADPWQRHGLGGLLVRLLAGLAERRGIAAFDATVIIDNRGALGAIRSGWPAAARASLDGNAARYRLPLPVPAAP